MTDDKNPEFSGIEIDIPDPNKTPPNYAQERNALLLDWKDLIDSNELANQLTEIFEKCTALPNPTVQIPVLVAFSMLPTAIINTAPIGVAHGESGSGKSDLGSIIASLYDAPVLPANTTYAGLRNHIKFYKYYDEQCEYEKHFAVVFDDIGTQTIRGNEALFTLLKTGCNRKTSLTKIALPQGEMLEFNTFCSKFLTSIHAFWEELELLELKRRCLIFKTVKKKDLIDIIDPKEINFDGISSKLDFYWRERERREVFRKRLIGFGRHPQRELLACMSTVLSLPKDEVLRVFNEFENMTAVEVGDPLIEFIKQQINEEGFTKIYTQNIKLLISRAKEKGIIDNCSIQTFGQSLKALGWNLVTEKNAWYYKKKELN